MIEKNIIGRLKEKIFIKIDQSGGQRKRFKGMFEWNQLLHQKARAKKKKQPVSKGFKKKSRIRSRPTKIRSPNHFSPHGTFTKWRIQSGIVNGTVWYGTVLGWMICDPTVWFCVTTQRNGASVGYEKDGVAASKNWKNESSGSPKWTNIYRKKIDTQKVYLKGSGSRQNGPQAGAEGRRGAWT